MKVMTLLGTRPEMIKLSEIIKKLDASVDHVFVHTGQNYDPELSDVFYKDLDLRQPDYQLNVKAPTLGALTANIFKSVEEVILKENPDAVVILGDTNSGLAGILVKRLKIPFFHLEAGNRSFDDNVPEEINRRLLDHIADVNLVYTQNQRTYLLEEGLAKDRTFIMGSPMREVLVRHMPKIKASTIIEDLKLKPMEYFLVSIHRDENVESEKNLAILLDTLKEIAKKLPIVVTTHPRLRNKLQDKKIKNVQFLKPFGFVDYVRLQIGAKVVISDSGTIAEESAILGLPAITIRNAHERPESTDAGSLLMTGVDKENILRCLELVKRPTTIPSDYATADCSERVLKVILGYTSYVKKYVYGT